MTADITNIKRFAVHDGDGIRTTVFFKGCPLRCVWCHNPETLSRAPCLAFYRHKCRDCGICADICKCHTVGEAGHVFDRSKCVLCGKCTDVCPNDALELFGRKASSEEIMDIVLKDKSFYDESGGGITLSGGECLLQADFCAELLKKSKENGISTAVDTCGYVSKSAFDKVIPYTDIFLYDIKAFDEDVHIKCTSVSNKIILENLQYINSLGTPVEVRIPFVPGYNDGQIEKIGNFLKGISVVAGVKVLPYHDYARSKYSALGIEDKLPNRLPTDDEIKNAENILGKFGLKIK